LGASASSFLRNRTAPRRSSSSRERSLEADDFASTYRKFIRNARMPCSAAATATCRTSRFFMSFDRPWVTTRLATGDVEGRCTIPRTSPSPPAMGSRTSPSAITAHAVERGSAYSTPPREADAFPASEHGPVLVHHVQVLEDSTPPDEDRELPVLPPEPLRQVPWLSPGGGNPPDIRVPGGGPPPSVSRRLSPGNVGSGQASFLHAAHASKTSGAHFTHTT